MAVTGSWQYRPGGLLPAERELPTGVTRIAAAVEYDGSGFCGWQRQAHCTGVQAVVEAALSRVAAAPVVVACAGRTDAGVHATNQIIHFDTQAQRPARAWVLGANTHLPPGVRIHWAHPVTGQFHARFSATARTYRYVICNQTHRPALLREQLTWERAPLAVEAMQTASAALLGERDFSSFRGAGCQSNSPWRNVESLTFARSGNLVVMEIRANAFLLHMVRNIAGALMAVGRGERTAAWIGELLAQRDRTQGAITAPAAGLYLVAVRYPAEFGVPVFPPGPVFLDMVS